MILGDAVGVGLRSVAVLGGLAAALLAIYLAHVIPPRMGVEGRPRPVGWWLAATAAGIGYGWLVAPVAGWSLLPAFVVFGGATLALTLIDLDHQLIPNRVLFPALGLAAGLLAIGAASDGEWDRLARGMLGAGVYFLWLLVVALLARGGFGMGDVKLALLLGLFLGYLGWGVLGVGAVLAVLLGGIASIVLLVAAGKDRQSRFAYGPYLVAGAWIGVFWGTAIADWYLGSG